MSHFLELDILVNMTLRGTAGVCLKDEIEMLVSNIELISQSMNKLSEHVQIVGVFFLWLLPIYVNLNASREPVILIQCTSL